MNFERYSETFLHFYSHEIPQLLINVINIKKSFNYVDMGCGDGSLLVSLLNQGFFIEANRIIGVDLSPERLIRLNSFNAFELIVSDVTNIPEIEANSIDVISCTQVIEHLPDENKLLNEVKRILKKDGILYIASVVKKRYGWFYYKTAEGKWGLDPTHLREYKSKDDFLKVICNSGYEIIESSLSPLRLSILEFFVRRIIVPLFKPKYPNNIFQNNKLLDLARRKINLRPPGYFIVEATARKSKIE